MWNKLQGVKDKDNELSVYYITPFLIGIGKISKK